jgi:hypothetical protein
MKRMSLGVLLASLAQAVAAQPLPIVNGLPVKFEGRFDKQKNVGDVLVTNPNGVEKKCTIKLAVVSSDSIANTCDLQTRIPAKADKFSVCPTAPPSKGKAPFTVKVDGSKCD